MLIRSQNKETLVNIEASIVLYISGTIGKKYPISTSNGYVIGFYSTKAKVMKVLDMIQEAYEEYKITCTFLTGFTGHRAIVESNDIRVNGYEELIKSFKKNMVFQMPEDSEVEA
nr:MAG TPA: hypothetical protein [Caudoviricetes sp.]